MRKKHLKESSGITLIEILVTLAILTMVTGISYGLLNTTMKYNTKTQSHVNLRQEANLIITTLRQQHQQQGGYYNCANDYLSNGQFSFTDPNNSNNTFILRQEGTVIEDNCSNSYSSRIKTNTDLEVEFTIFDNLNNEFELITIIEAKMPISAPAGPCKIYDQGDSDWSIIRTYLNLNDPIPNNTVILIKGNLRVGNGKEIEGVSKDGVKIYVTGNMHLDSGGKVKNVTIYVKEDFNHRQGSHISHQDNPAEVHVNGDYSPHTGSHGEPNVFENGNNGFVAYQEPSCVGPNQEENISGGNNDEDNSGENNSGGSNSGNNETPPPAATLPQNPFYNYLKNENVFVYGSKLQFSGSQMNGQGASMVIQGSLSGSQINGGAFSNVSNIYINGSTSFDGGSAGLGSSSNPGTLYINGNLDLWGGTRDIYGNVYVYGNFRLKDARIYGNVYVQGDVEIGWTPTLSQSSRVYYTGNLIYPSSMSNSITSKFIKVAEIPQINMPSYTIPKLKPDNWYTDNGYLSGGNLANGRKIFSHTNYTFTSSQTFQNVVIVSKGDITLSNWMHVTGVLFAPNGKVTFGGGSFEGLVIAKDGFFVTSGGSTVTFKNISEYIPDPKDAPFE